MTDYVAGSIRQSFHELLQSRGISIYSEGPESRAPVTQAQMSGLLDLVIEAVGAEIASRQQGKPQLIFHTPDEQLAWDQLKMQARMERVVFQVSGIHATFYMGPDIFPDSYALAWETHEERQSGNFMDHRVRSSDPDDFLKRFEMIREELED